MTKNKSRHHGLAALAIFDTSPQGQQLSTAGERIQRFEQRLAELGIPRRLDDPQAVDAAVDDILVTGYLSHAEDERRVTR